MVIQIVLPNHHNYHEKVGEESNIPETRGHWPKVPLTDSHMRSQ
jgi:hypothetical protein